jgi:hypothetical protein
MVAPAPAGSALIRDTRAWHGGCPNVSRYVRAIPRTGYSAQIYQQADPNAAPRKVKPGLTRMKHEVWETLTPKGKEICAHLKMDEGEVLEPVDIDISEGLTAGGPGSNKVELVK